MSQREQIDRTEDFLRQESLKLARVLLPKLDPEALNTAYQRTGLSFLTPAVLEMACTQIQELEARRRELEAMPEFPLSPADARRLAQEELVRVQEFETALSSILKKCQSHPRFQALLENGFGTSRYSTPFWRYSFYLDRSAAAELCASTGKKDFRELREEYESAQDSLQSLRQRSQRLSGSGASAREEWELCGRQLEKLKASQLNTLQTRLQLALLKGGEVWQTLKANAPGVEFLRMMASVDRLRDQLQNLRGGRS